MAGYSTQQIASLLHQQGFPKDKIPVMTAIAKAESSGNPQAFNPTGLDKSYGLFQVNMYGGLGPARMKQFGLKSEKELFDPTVNVRAAKQILGSQGLGAWTTYTSGKYKQFLPQAQQALSQLGQSTEQPVQQITVEQDKNQLGKEALAQYLKTGNMLLSELINKSKYGLDKEPDVTPLSIKQKQQSTAQNNLQDIFSQLTTPTSYI